MEQTEPMEPKVISKTSRDFAMTGAVSGPAGVWLSTVTSIPCVVSSVVTSADVSNVVTSVDCVERVVDKVVDDGLAVGVVVG